MAHMRDREIISRPHRVHWAGWESSTYKLQQMGWEFSAEERFDERRIRLALRHQAAGMYGVSHWQEYDHFMPPGMADHNTLAFHIPYMTGNYRVLVQDDFSLCRPVDMQPMFRGEREYKSIEDFSIFAAPMARTNEIIVNPNSVPELMDRILELQEPGRKEHFRKMALEARAQPRHEFHAQILSLVA